MNPSTLSRVFLGLALGSALVSGTAPAQAIEQPRYRVEQVLGADSIEVRRYEPYIVAEVVVPGPAEQAGNQGFSFLGGYIFGRNKGERKIAMTAPVVQTPQPTKIAMTAPVAQMPVEGGQGFAVQFMMPSSFTMETLPEPLDPRVTLKPVAEQRVVAITYSGTWSQSNYDEHLAKLRNAAQAAGLKTEGEPVYARYNGPWVPWFMRKNEIWLAVR
ncbi:MAG: heme-binding protein [Betaproteobacteria bacterium]|jgi:hypothetical protein|nr:heme-binding protein [Betaproteobacteria bacterium]